VSRQNDNLSAELYDYILDNSLRDQPVLKRLREKTAELPMAGMQISPDQGQFMALLVGAIGAKRTLEMGVFTGYSSLVVALALPSEGKVVACDVSTEYTDIAKPFWEEAGVADKIDLRIGPALDTLDSLIQNGESGDYDFAFIDADKDAYSGYFERCLKLVRQGGLILLDNMFMGGRVHDPSADGDIVNAVRELNAALRDDSRIDVSLLPVGDGLTLARKR
jgi:predicted O-methyltransferase YrrM